MQGGQTMLHKASSDGAVEMVRFLATECGSVDLEAKDKVTGSCVHVPNLFLCEAPTQWWYLDGIYCNIRGLLDSSLVVIWWVRCSMATQHCMQPAVLES